MFTRISICSLVVFTTVVDDKAHAQKVYWTQSNPIAIQRSNLDGSEQEIMLERDVRHPFSMRVDPSRQKLYWAENYGPPDRTGIFRSNYDASEIETIVDEANVGSPVGMDVDLIYGKIYWIARFPTPRMFQIFRCDLDGSQIEAVLAVENSPVDLVLDPPMGKIYWSTSGHNEGVYWANLDGTAVQQIIETEFGDLRELTLDSAAGKIYWVDSRSLPGTSIQRANLDGTETQTLDLDLVNRPRALAIHTEDRNLYFDQFSTDTIARVNLDNGEIVTVFDGLPSDVDTMTLDPAQARIFWGSSQGMYIADIDGTSIQETHAAVSIRPRVISSQTATGMMYWRDYNIIKRASLSGGAIQTVTFASEDISSMGFAISSLTNTVYWTQYQQNSKRIRRAGLDGSGHQVVVTTTPDLPVGLAVDASAGKLYWTRVSPTSINDRIQRANLDGSVIEDVVTNSIKIPHDVVSDPVHKKIYWTENGASYGDGTIRRANADGSNIEIIVSGIVYNDVEGIEVDSTNEKLYWALAGVPSVIQRANLLKLSSFRLLLGTL